MRPWLYSDIMMQVDYSCYKKMRNYFLVDLICCLAVYSPRPDSYRDRFACRPSLRKRKEGKKKLCLPSLRSREEAGGELTNKADILSPLLY